MAPRSDDDNLQAIFANLGWLRHRLITRYNDLVDAVREAGLPGTPTSLLVRCYLKEPMEKLYHGVSDAAGMLQTILDHDTPIISLVRASGAWIQIQRTAAHIHRQTDPATRDDHNDDLVSWRDKAATVYRHRVPTQADAVAQITTLAGTTSEWLDAVATANLQFIADMCKIAGKVIAMMTEATVDLVEIVSIPRAAAVIGTLCGEVIGQLAPETAFGALSAALRAEARNFAKKRQQNQHELVLDGAWPQAVRL